MGRSPCCSKIGLHRGPWTAKEDALLTQYIQIHGEGNWKSLPSKAGLLRCGKSCRLRWMNYLRPDIKRGNITPEEDDLIIRLHGLLGNRWSLIAGRLPGRTDNEIKNYWNTHLGKKLKSRGINLRTKKTKSDSKKAKNKKKMHKSSKVYLPKATRPTSFTCPWSLDDGGITGRFLMDDDDDDHGGLLNSCDLAHEQQSSNTDMMVEKVYEEYLELLNKDGNGGSLQGVELDSFDESLWASW